MKYDPARAQKLVRWSRPWHHFEAKPLDPQEPSIGRLCEELGEQLEAAAAVIDRLLAQLSPDQRLLEVERLNAPRRTA